MKTPKPVSFGSAISDTIFLTPARHSNIDTMALRHRFGAGLMGAIGVGAILGGLVIHAFGFGFSGTLMFLIGAVFLLIGSAWAVHQLIWGVLEIAAAAIFYFLAGNTTLGIILFILGLLTMALGAISRVRPIARRRGRKRRPIR